MVDLKITWKMHEYPKEAPEEGRHDILGIDNQGYFQFVFYMKESAAHDHSVWQDIHYWCYEDEAFAAIKVPIQQLQRDAAESQKRKDRHNAICCEIYGLRHNTDDAAKMKTKALSKEADELEADMKAHGEI